ncbi:hypothetical protein [Pantoea ananatis]|uniref:hypothetical protein n=1 Tax=Pantoea ananas TaxID=553 RepID=UPI0007DAC6F4|nr:hypothetical protein [Pantoea ananatis]MCW0314840.1 hypothetical protein [Pantoea ananatis]UYL03694.1 hypothetical protein NG830_10325 [Pantoea ananatis]
MSLNDLHYTSIFLMLIFMIVFFAFFVHFIYKELGGVKIGKDTFLFFDFMFFGSGFKSNAPSLAMAMIILLSGFSTYSKNHDVTALYEGVVVSFAMLFLFVHCRFFSGISYSKTRVKLIKEFFLNLKLTKNFFFLWLSRVFYIAVIFYAYGV